MGSTTLAYQRMTYSVMVRPLAPKLTNVEG